MKIKNPTTEGSTHPHHSASLDLFHCHATTLQYPREASLTNLNHKLIFLAQIIFQESPRNPIQNVPDTLSLDPEAIGMYLCICFFLHENKAADPQCIIKC